MPADFVIKQGDELPNFTDTLTYSTGVAAEPEAVEFVMRSLTAAESITLKGTSKVVSKAKGEVSFEPAAGDTETPGNYAAVWKATINKKSMQFPTTGYLWVEVQANLTTKGGAMLVTLEEVKDHLNIQANDRTHDTKLERWIKGVGPLIENLVGPITIAVHDEYYEGGHVSIGLRHTPTFGYGAEPFLFLMSVSEYRGPIEYNLAVVPAPTQGSVYSVMLNAELGIECRRTAGGGTYPFWRDPNHPQQSIHTVYASGLKVVPEPITLAALETIRDAYENTMKVGAGFKTEADRLEPSMPLFGAIPRHAQEFLAPYRRPPAFA